ncbi:endonuclease/exonuclease/phosphatase family protein [Streptomyces sp. BE20]|uniref:endonuclease/exonuclease/phosphatase family protein n=1 Tax=Streptomyces sp. BE20 TaxID=3002525 RepID=UPI002E7A6681|nr:endonuclease/exonuclease/phosphatase family protein [Streptomyces sp. BE20]MEE1823762.1 endonuclease/exonuclease/phosphatase family protein [Streptomyces sp. BE20]
MSTRPPSAEGRATDPEAVVEHIGWNIQHGRHLTAALDLLEHRAGQAGRRPDLLTLQELRPGQGEQVAERLALTYVASPPNERPGSETALFYNPTLFQADPAWTQYPSGIRHNPAVALLRMVHPDSGETSFRPLVVASCHASYSDPVHREHQARFFSEAAKDQWLALVQGDWNSWPVWGCPTTLDAVADRAYAQNRSVLQPDGTMRPDDRADRLLTYGGMTDVGRHAAAALGQEGADRATTGHGADKARQRVPAHHLPPGGQGPIDRTYAANDLLPALHGATVLTGQAVERISDHLPQVTRWRLPGLWEVMSRRIVPTRH